jgi:hypothetical protein
MYGSNNTSGIRHLQPTITGIGHGVVFRPCKTFPDDQGQFSSNQLAGMFFVYGVSMNTLTIYDSPYGNVEIEWTDAHGKTQNAILPVLERDDVQGSMFSVGVTKDPRYVPANFRFDKLSYNDFVTKSVVSGTTETMAGCSYTDGACAPLAPFVAYDIRVRSPFRKKWYCGGDGGSGHGHH